MKKLFLLFGWLIPSLGWTQPYSIDWHKVAGGGGTSTGSFYSMSGTIGQADASGPMTGPVSGTNLFTDRRILVALCHANARRTVAHHHLRRQPSHRLLAAGRCRLDVANQRESCHANVGQLSRRRLKQPRHQCSTQGKSLLPFDAVDKNEPMFKC